MGHKRIQIPGIEESLYDKIKLRTDALSERLRYHYNFNSQSIIIDTLPSDIHESIQEYLTDKFKYSLRRFVTRFVPNAKVITSGSVDRELIPADGSRLKGKTPDQAFLVKIPGIIVRKFPNLVVEVGYSESLPNLIDDARRWLTETQGTPVLCVLIFDFKKPSQDRDFADMTKWKALLHVYDRYESQFHDCNFI